MDQRELALWFREARRQAIIGEARRINEARLAQADQEHYGDHVQSLEWQLRGLDEDEETEITETGAEPEEG
jgi:hypothetical protein